MEDLRKAAGIGPKSLKDETGNLEEEEDEEKSSEIDVTVPKGKKYPKLVLPEDDDSMEVKSNFTSESDRKPPKDTKVEAARKEVLGHAREHLGDGDHDHESHSEEEEVEEVNTIITEVSYLTGEKVEIKGDVFSLTVAANILNTYGVEGSYCTPREYMFCLSACVYVFAI